MELTGSQPAFPDNSSDLLIAEGSRGFQVIPIGGSCGVAMNEIHPFRGDIAVEQWAIAVMA